MTHPATYLNLGQAAALAGMTRQAFAYHVSKGQPIPEIDTGKVKLFRPSTVRQWIQKRKKSGISKRGPQPQK